MTPTGFKEAWKSLYEAGWKQIAVDAGVRRRRRAALAAGARRGDDQRRQHRVRDVPGARVRRGRGHRVVRHATSRRSSTARACSAGKWGGTMCLTEPQAGSDVGSAKTTATQQRRRQLHDPRDEDLHLRRRPRPRREHHPPRARARRRRARRDQGAHALHRPEDPRRRRRHARRAERRRASANIEHKMGINGSATCVLNFGDDGQLHRLARRRRREAEPGHAADVQADEQRAHRASASRASASRRARS